jgi:hypothetical protein
MGGDSARSGLADAEVPYYTTLSATGAVAEAISMNYPFPQAVAES